MTAQTLGTILAAFTGAYLLYAELRRRRPASAAPRPFFVRVGWGFLSVSFIAMLDFMSLPSAIFAWTTFVMLIWSTIPIATAWWKWREGGQG